MRDSTPSLRGYDGVVCFGGVDWWYHNRGHYDLQMMRELSSTLPVLYVNSVGMRMPSPREGSMFLRRVTRKARSLARGLVRIRDRFHVLSPACLPGGGGEWNAALLAAQVTVAARRAGIRRPLLWVACPAAARAALRIEREGLVFQRTDRFEAFHGVDAERVRDDVARLLQQADLSLYCSRSLHASEVARASAFVDHGIDLRRYALAGESNSEPEELRGIAHPRVGFVGGIDALTFDPELFRSVVAKLPHVQFVLVGGCSLPAGWIDAPNVHALGRRPFERVPEYLAACDALVMPWNRSEWIRACNPIKLKEYLAVGRPIVSTPFDELERYRGLVHVATDADEFVEELLGALDGEHDPRPGRRKLAGQGWNHKAREVVTELARLGVSPVVKERVA
ncbi:MAG: glycosyltransferase [Planctomycetota bacterium]|nr:glycosyltransferase [Planctomycetota bacterium]